MKNANKRDEIKAVLKSTRRGYVTVQSSQGPVAFSDKRECAYVFRTYESLGAFVRYFEYIPNEGLLAEDISEESNDE
jgi:hypothetical protein